LIAIDNKLISDEIVSEQFVCDLTKCKGGCCEDGDAGAPLEKEELDHINKFYELFKPYMTPQGIAVVEKEGRYHYDTHFGWVTPTIEGGLCVYAFRDPAGIIKCGIEQAYRDGKIEWKKPISCHLFPIKITKGKQDDYVNYEPRPQLCKPGCIQGEKLKVPVYVFLKDALVRKYGEEFWVVLDQIAQAYFKNKK
jgi:Protein of unknown function (DUF3109)